MFDNPGFDDVVVPNKTIVEIDVADKNNEQIQETIDTTLSTGFEGSNNRNDKVIEIKDPIEFTSNKVYKDNEWLKFSSNSKITLEGGNLNVVLPNDGEITVAPKKANDIKLKLNGKGTLKIESTDQTAYEIIGKSVISGETKIIVPAGSKSIKIESVDLIEDGTIKVQDTSFGEVQLTVDNIRVKSGASVSLDNMKIGSSITIPQTSAINLENVDVEGIKIVYMLISYMNMKKPVITGSLKNEPNEFIIDTTTPGDDDEPLDGDNFIIVHAKFDCNKYVDLIDIEQTKFTQKFCTASNNAKILDENSLQDLIVNIPEPIEKGPSNKKLEKIMLIVIIVVCIIVAASIGGGIACCCCGCCCCKKQKGIKSSKRRHHHHSESEDDDKMLESI